MDTYGKITITLFVNMSSVKIQTKPVVLLSQQGVTQDEAVRVYEEFKESNPSLCKHPDLHCCWQSESVQIS